MMVKCFVETTAEVDEVRGAIESHGCEIGDWDAVAGTDGKQKLITVHVYDPSGDVEDAVTNYLDPAGIEAFVYT